MLRRCDATILVILIILLLLIVLHITKRSLSLPSVYFKLRRLRSESIFTIRPTIFKIRLTVRYICTTQAITTEGNWY